MRRENATHGYNGDHGSSSGLSTDSDGSSATMKPAYDGKRLVRLQTRDVTKYRVGQQVLNKGREKNLNGLVVDVCVSEHRAGDENGEGRMGRVTIAPYGDEWQGGPEAEDVEEDLAVPDTPAGETRRPGSSQQEHEQGHEQQRGRRQQQQPDQQHQQQQ